VKPELRLEPYRGSWVEMLAAPSGRVIVAGEQKRGSGQVLGAIPVCPASKGLWTQ
jgi:hypothetical protein